MEKEVIRYSPNINIGLTLEQINERIEHNLVNKDMTRKNQKYKINNIY